MPSYEHNELVKDIIRMDDPPADPHEFSEWIKGGAHLEFLRRNANADELAIYASGDYTFVHSMVVPNDMLSPLDEADLLSWSCNPYTSIASYVSGGGREGIWVERNSYWTGSKTLNKGIHLIFGRTFEGWNGPDRNYFELHQEYSHLASIHWRPEHRAYCRFDENGDLDHVVSITARDEKHGNVVLASFNWEQLEHYLAASNSTLVRMFDFTLLRRGSFSGWSDGPEQLIHESDEFFYRQKITGQAAYTRGIQLIRLRRSESHVLKDMNDSWFRNRGAQHVDYIAHDWRNKRITTISTNPDATTNYFDAQENALPYELSPAFFRPEVLLKYKADRDKYTVAEREVSCRASWHLRGIDVNEAGQVHAYICDLRDLPYSEQLHWKSFNEKPKASISERAVTNDFKGEFTSFSSPLAEVLRIVRRWHEANATWWTLRDEKLLERVNIPVTSSRDEWAEAFMDLAKLVNEGFEVKNLRERLRVAAVDFDSKEGSIVLLERLLNQGHESDEQEQLHGLRTAQKIRSVVKGHAGSSEANQLTTDALSSHETFANHFKFVSNQIASELSTLEAMLL